MAKRFNPCPRLVDLKIEVAEKLTRQSVSCIYSLKWQAKWGVGGTTYLERSLVELHPGNGFAGAHPAAVAEDKLDVALHLGARCRVRLEESLGSEDGGVFAK